MSKGTRISRRRFLALAGTATAAGTAALACGLATQAEQPDVAFIESSRGMASNARGKILIAALPTIGYDGQGV
jgi:hypothetical protein